MKIDRILARLETGLGATQLSPNVQSLTLTLSQRTRASGARHFWREHLRRLQYANPNLPIVVNYPREPCMPKLEIKFANAATDSLSVAGLPSDEICRRLLEKTTS
ncbi:hypothetical protein GQ54DRAFT_191332 [Martensiomyces pterosporus]|nr:hypothetical protein GQ54DRAFT_191332 [Martensiomyces pterosporus]